MWCTCRAVGREGRGRGTETEEKEHENEKRKTKCQFSTRRNENSFLLLVPPSLCFKQKRQTECRSWKKRGRTSASAPTSPQPPPTQTSSSSHSVSSPSQHNEQRWTLLDWTPFQIGSDELLLGGPMYTKHTKQKERKKERTNNCQFSLSFRVFFINASPASRTNELTSFLNPLSNPSFSLNSSHLSILPSFVLPCLA